MWHVTWLWVPILAIATYVNGILTLTILLSFLNPHDMKAILLHLFPQHTLGFLLL